MMLTYICILFFSTYFLWHMMSLNAKIIFNININLISWFSQAFTIKVHYIDALPCNSSSSSSSL